MVGDQGEKQALEFLMKKGYRILDTNYRQPYGEIDIIAFDPYQREYVFVEVKCRKNAKYGYPEEFVDEGKMEKITRTAYRWLNEANLDDPEWRIDVIAILGRSRPRIEHLTHL